MGRNLTLAADIGGIACTCDVTNSESVTTALDAATAAHGVPRIVKGKVVIGNGGADLGLLQTVDAGPLDALMSASAATPRADAPDAGPDAGLLPRGTSIGRYLVTERLGAGGMGVVYAAYDPELNRKVAIKLLHAQREDSAQTSGRVRLLREAQAMAKLSHPNVIGVFDVGTFHGQVFVAMEFVDGGTLTGWLQAAPRTRRQILEKFLQAGRGLAAAHAAGLVHRDFKPDSAPPEERAAPSDPQRTAAARAGDGRAGPGVRTGRRARGLRPPAKATGVRRPARTLVTNGGCRAPAPSRWWLARGCGPGTSRSACARSVMARPGPPGQGFRTTLMQPSFLSRNRS